MKQFRLICLLFFFFCTGLLICSGCSGDDQESAYTWERTCHLPSADGISTIGTDPLIIDLSHTDQGYMMVLYTGDAQKANIQVAGPDGVNYKYFIEPSEKYIPITFTGGDGSYVVSAFENIEGDQYASLFSEVVDVTLEDEFLPYMYPNQSQYVQSGDNRYD